MHRTLYRLQVINPRCACARVTVLVLCPSVTALAALHTSNQRYSWVSLRLFLDLDSWIFGKKTPFKSYGVKKQYANELELTASHFRALSGSTKGRN